MRNCIKKSEEYAFDRQEGVIFYLKPPYSQGRVGFKNRRFKTSNELLALLNEPQVQTLKLPYIMIQVFLPNPKEVKLIYFNGEFQYFTKTSTSTAPRQNSEGIKLFAANVLCKLQQHCPAVTNHGLFRIDIFRFNDRLFLNEFEAFDSQSDGNNKQDADSRSLMQNFWYQELKKLCSYGFLLIYRTHAVDDIPYFLYPIYCC